MSRNPVLTTLMLICAGIACGVVLMTIGGSAAVALLSLFGVLISAFGVGRFVERWRYMRLAPDCRTVGKQQDLKRLLVPTAFAAMGFLVVFMVKGGANWPIALLPILYFAIAAFDIGRLAERQRPRPLVPGRGALARRSDVGRHPGLIALMVIVGVILLLPGICVLAFIGIGGKITGAEVLIVPLSIFCFAVSGIGVLMIIAALR